MKYLTDDVQIVDIFNLIHLLSKFLYGSLPHSIILNIITTFRPELAIEQMFVSHLKANRPLLTHTWSHRVLLFNLLNSLLSPYVFLEKLKKVHSLLGLM